MGLGRAFKKLTRKAGKLLKQNSLPIIASVVSGGTGPGISKLLELVSQTDGEKVNNLEDLVNKLGNKDFIEKLKILEAEHEHQLLKIQFQDRASARELGETLSKSESVLNRNIMPVLALFVCFAFFACLGTLILYPTAIAAGSKDVVMVLTGILGSAFKDIIGYVFGSSHSSAKKNDQLEKLTDRIE